MTEKRLYIETWGCQMNRHQSEGMAGTLVRAGYRIVDSLSEADVVLFNGCMVRQKAEEKVYGRIGAVVEEKRHRPVILGVGGCLGQIRGASLTDRFRAVDFVFGAYGHGSLPGVLDSVAEEGTRPVSLPSGFAIDEIPSERSSGATAMVTITEGCSNFCSYCVVPYARGPMRSRDPGRIALEIEGAVAAGHREVLLLGQNVNAYGTDRPEFGSFVELLRTIADLGPDRIRFTSSHPRDLGVDLMEAMAEIRQVCPHLHVAAQSGSDRILQAMNRGTTRTEFLGKLARARALVDGLNVTTDLIVGYPGESEKDFEDSLDLIEAGRFGSIYAAKYSPRPHARSARAPDDVSEATKDDRLHRILDRQRAIALEENERFLGESVEVLIEGASRDDAWLGRAADHRTVVARVEDDGADVRVGSLITARIEAVTAAALTGTVCVPIIPGV